MDFTVQIAHSVDEIDRDAWEHLGAGRPFSSMRWYRFGEAVLKENPPTYIFLSHQGEPVARAAFWLNRQEWLPVTSKILRQGLEQLLKQWPLFVCETPLASMPGLILPDSPLHVKAIKDIASCASFLGKDQKASFTIFSYTQPEDARKKIWPDGFLPISYPDEETSLQITWPNFDNYLMHLAHSTRRNYRLHCAKADELKIALALEKNLDVREVLPLIKNVDTFHGVGHRPWTLSMLNHLDMVDSTWITARIAGRLAGCCAVIGDNNILTATLLGLDYSFPDYLYVYYQVIYGAIRHAVESGALRLYGGGGAYELKRRLGFERLPDDYLMARPNNPFLGWLLQKTATLTGIRIGTEAIAPKNGEGETGA
jgi:hypothetical protein